MVGGDGSSGSSVPRGDRLAPPSNSEEPEEWPEEPPRTETLYTPGIAFFNGFSSTASTMAMNNAIDARMMKNCEWLQRSQ